MSKLFTRAFWVSIGWALLRTGLAALVPFLPALFLNPATAWFPTVLALGPVLILAVLTSLAGLPADGGGTWWQIGISRAVRQFGQYFLGALPASFALLGIDWRTLLLSAAASAAATFVLYCLTVIPTPVLYSDGIVTINQTQPADPSTTAAYIADRLKPTPPAEVEETEGTTDTQEA